MGSVRIEPCSSIQPLAMTPEVSSTGDGGPTGTLNEGLLAYSGPKEMSLTRSCPEEVWVLAKSCDVDELRLFETRDIMLAEGLQLASVVSEIQCAINSMSISSEGLIDTWM